jgi:hypothetical protein
MVCEEYNVRELYTTTMASHTIPYHTIPYHTIPYHTIPYHPIPSHPIPCHTIPCYGRRASGTATLTPARAVPGHPPKGWDRRRGRRRKATVPARQTSRSRWTYRHRPRSCREQSMSCRASALPRPPTALRQCAGRRGPRRSSCRACSNRNRWTSADGKALGRRRERRQAMRLRRRTSLGRRTPSS